MNTNTNDAKQTKPFRVTVRWGEYDHPGDELRTYAFATEVELNAFLLRCNEGWSEYDIIELSNEEVCS